MMFHSAHSITAAGEFGYQLLDKRGFADLLITYDQENLGIAVGGIHDFTISQKTSARTWNTKSAPG